MENGSEKEKDSMACGKEKKQNLKLNVEFDESKYISHSIYVTHSQ